MLLKCYGYESHALVVDLARDSRDSCHGLAVIDDKNHFVEILCVVGAGDNCEIGEDFDIVLDTNDAFLDYTRSAAGDVVVHTLRGSDPVTGKIDGPNQNHSDGEVLRIGLQRGWRFLVAAAFASEPVPSHPRLWSQFDTSRLHGQFVGQARAHVN